MRKKKMTSMHMTKVPEYPRPHDNKVSFAMSVESTAVRNATIFPIITYDEGLGAMSAYKSNPVNASFVEASTDHCYPTSKVSRVFAHLQCSMSKIMLETDKVHAVRFATMEIHSAFNETGLAADEVSTLDLNEILELQVETIDRQMYPLYNTVDLADYKSNAKLNMPAEAVGLDTDLELEAVAFNTDDYYDCLHYYTNGHKLASVTSNLRWHTLTRQKPFKDIFFNQHSNTKYLNPYTLLAALIYVPQNADYDSFGRAADTTIDTCTIDFDMHIRYNEFNHEFNHSML